MALKTVSLSLSADYKTLTITATTTPLAAIKGEIYYDTVSSVFYTLSSTQLALINANGTLALTPADIGSDDECFDGLLVARLYSTNTSYKQGGVLSDKELKCCLAAQYDKALSSDCGCAGKKKSQLLDIYLAFKAALYSIDCYNYSNAEDLYNKAKEMCGIGKDGDDDCGCS